MAASRAAKLRGKVKMEDFLFVLRKDQKKLARAEELLFRYDELLKARKAFEADATDNS
jgi:transcription initiation factor TFIID subunit 13